MFLAVVTGNLFFYLRHYYTQFQPYCIRYHEASTWSVAITGNEFQTLQILPSTVVTIWLIVLHFRLENGKFQSLLIFNDALSDKDYRGLVVTLKIAGLSEHNTV